MLRWATETIIGTTDFSSCKVLLRDAAQLATNYRGSVAIAADGTPHVMRVLVGAKGAKVGCEMPHAQATLINQARTEIQASELAQVPFRFRCIDDLYNLDVLVYPDRDQEWFTHGPQSGGIIENVVFRFVVMALNI